MRYTTTVFREPFLVLLIEDDPAHAELLMRSFEEHPIASEIVHFTDGEEALAYLFQHGPFADTLVKPRPHIILLDLRLPHLDGLDVLMKVKTADEEDLQRIPVVVLTTSAAEQDVAQAYEHHANSYVLKPLDYEGFTTLVDRLGSYWFERNFYPWFSGLV